MKLLILIPCSSKKTKRGEMEYHKTGQNGIVSSLSKGNGERLLELRKQVALAFQYPPGPDLGFETDTALGFLEARRRYQGNLYRKITVDSWGKLEGTSESGLVIVSALYGLLNYDEPIRYYNRSMNEHIVPKVLLKTWWKRNSLTNVLLDYIRQNKVEEIHDFLSEDYRRALANLSLCCRLLGVHYFPYSYKGLGVASDFRRGIDVNSLIQSREPF